jgi:hypothetical protein
LDVADVPQVSGQAGFEWWIDDWIADPPEGCAPEDPNPDGEIVIVEDFPYPTPIFYEFCP